MTGGMTLNVDLSEFTQKMKIKIMLFSSIA
jgi:hypothetical protein